MGDGSPMNVSITLREFRVEMPFCAASKVTRMNEVLPKKVGSNYIAVIELLRNNKEGCKIFVLSINMHCILTNTHI